MLLAEERLFPLVPCKSRGFEILQHSGTVLALRGERAEEMTTYNLDEKETAMKYEANSLNSVSSTELLDRDLEGVTAGKRWTGSDLFGPRPILDEAGGRLRGN
jgi:hypothetical protein